MNLTEKDKKYVWHPFTSFGNAMPNLPIHSAKGVYLYSDDNRAILDAISSWWVNIHGHSHPYLADAITKQANTLEHVIFAGFTHTPAVTLAERLLKILPSNQSKVFFSDNGSTACEVAIKMALQYFHNLGTPKRKIIALDGAYHGDTFGAMSVGARNAFSAPFSPFLFDVEVIDLPQCDTMNCCLGICTGTRENAPNCLNIKQIIEKFSELIATGEVAAFMYEPIVQGAAGIRMYSPEILDKLLEIAQKNDVICIADEVMTGFGRTGKLFASEYMTQKPDIMCLSKGLTGGVMPLGVTTCTEKIVAAYYSSDVFKTFFHGHSFTANPLACSVANASLDLLLKAECMENINRITQKHIDFEQKIIKNIQNNKSNNKSNNIKNVRTLGTILAFEVNNDQKDSYFNTISADIYGFFLAKNILLRPLGNTIYIMPPYVITNEELDRIYDAIEELLSITN